MADKAKSPDPVDQEPSPNAERQAKEHSSKTSTTKPVGERTAKSRKTGPSAVKTTPTTVGAQPAAKSGGVSVALDKRLEEILDNLRGHTSRHEYIQQLVTVHLNNADPNGIHVDGDDLPGNEREIARLTGKVPAGAKKVRFDQGPVGNEAENFIPGHVPPIVRPDDDRPGNERPNFVPQGT